MCWQWRNEFEKVQKNRCVVKTMTQKKLNRKYRNGALSVERVHTNVVIVLQIAAIQKPANSGVRNRLGAASQIDQVIIPRPGLSHRSRGKRRRKFHRDVPIFRIIAPWAKPKKERKKEKKNHNRNHREKWIVHQHKQQQTQLGFNVFLAYLSFWRCKRRDRRRCASGRGWRDGLVRIRLGGSCRRWCDRRNFGHPACKGWACLPSKKSLRATDRQRLCTSDSLHDPWCPKRWRTPPPEVS